MPLAGTTVCSSFPSVSPQLDFWLTQLAVLLLPNGAGLTCTKPHVSRDCVSCRQVPALQATALVNMSAGLLCPREGAAASRPILPLTHRTGVAMESHPINTEINGNGKDPLQQTVPPFKAKERRKEGSTFQPLTESLTRGRLQGAATTFRACGIRGESWAALRAPEDLALRPRETRGRPRVTAGARIQGFNYDFNQQSSKELSTVLNFQKLNNRQHTLI